MSIIYHVRNDIYSHPKDLFLPTAEEDEDADATYDALDRLPSFWQTLDAPVDHIMTMLVLNWRGDPFSDRVSSRNDIACRLGDDPPDTNRADFLTPNPISGKRGYRAWTQGRINPQDLSHGSNWDFDLTEILKSSTPDFSDDVDVVMDKLQSHNLLLDDNRTKASLKLENDACEQLALDLGMASHVYTSKSFSKPDPAPPDRAQTFEDVVADMSVATGALSINVSGPPPVHFGFLTPVAAGPMDRSRSPSVRPEGTRTPQIGEEELIPLGVRLLMDEWKLGEDPQDYKYLDPYDDHTSSLMEPKHGAGNEPDPARKAQSQPMELSFGLNPPTVVAARVPPLVAPSKTVVKEREKTPVGCGFTQDHPLPAQGSSQEVMVVRTQVEPGKFGDRKAGQKKRQKRVGGF